MFGVIKILTQEIEDKIGIDLVLIFLALVDREDESASSFVLRILPLGLNSLLEVLDRVDSSPLLINLVSE